MSDSLDHARIKEELALFSEPKRTSLLDAIVDRGTAQIFTNVETRKEVNHYLSGGLKTFGLFAHGKLGMVTTIATHALDAASVDDPTSTRFVDAAIGALKGYAIKKTFNTLGEFIPGVAPKAISLGLASRFVDVSLTRQTWTDQKGGLDFELGWNKIKTRTFDPTAMSVDFVAGSAAHGMGGLLNRVTSGAIQRSPFLSTMVNGAGFGMVTGAHTEVLNQKAGGALDIDWTKVATRSLIQGGVDSIASIGGGIQADVQVRNAIKQKMAAARNYLADQTAASVETLGMLADRMSGPRPMLAFEGLGTEAGVGVRPGSSFNMEAAGDRSPVQPTVLEVRNTRGTVADTTTTGGRQAGGTPPVPETVSEVASKGRSKPRAVEVDEEVPAEKPARGKHKQTGEKTEYAHEEGFAGRIELPNKGVGNLAEMNGSLLRGARITTEAGMQALADRGVTMVIDLRCEPTVKKSEVQRDGGGEPILRAGKPVWQEQPWCEQRGIKYQAKELSPSNVTMEDVRWFLNTVQAEVAAGGKVFFHCHRGIDRTGVMGAAWRVANEGWTPERALREMEHFGYRGHSSTAGLRDVVREVARTSGVAAESPIAFAVKTAEVTSGKPGADTDTTTGEVGPGGKDPTPPAEPPVEKTQKKRVLPKEKTNGEYDPPTPERNTLRTAPAGEQLAAAVPKPANISDAQQAARKVAPHATEAHIGEALDIYNRYVAHFGPRVGELLATTIMRSGKDNMSAWERTTRAEAQELQRLDELDGTGIMQEMRQKMTELGNPTGRILAQMLESDPCAARQAINRLYTRHLSEASPEQFHSLVRAALAANAELPAGDLSRMVTAAQERVRVDLRKTPPEQRLDRISEYIDLASKLDGRTAEVKYAREDALVTLLSCATPQEVAQLSAERFQACANAVTTRSLKGFVAAERAKIIGEFLTDQRTPEVTRDKIVTIAATRPDTLAKFDAQQMEALRMAAESYFDRHQFEPGSKTNKAPTRIWGDPKERVASIVDKTVGTPMTAAELGSFLRTHFFPADIPRAVEVLAERSPYLSIHQVCENLKSVGIDIVTNHPELLIQGARDSRNHPVRQVRALCFTDTGGTLSYEFRKNSKVEVDVYQVQKQADGKYMVRSSEGIWELRNGRAYAVETEKLVVNVGNDGKDITARKPVLDRNGRMKVATEPSDLGPFVVFDQTHNVPESVKQALGLQQSHMPKYISDFHRGMNLMDMLEISMGQDRAAHKLGAAVKDRYGYCGIPRAHDRPADLPDATREAHRAMDAISGVTEVQRRQLETKTMLYLIDAAGTKASLDQAAYVLDTTQHFHSLRDMALEARELHRQIARKHSGWTAPPAEVKALVPIPKNIRFVLNADNGGSNHLIIDLYRRANGLTSSDYDQFFVPIDQISGIGSDKKTILYNDDYGYTCKQSINRTLKMTGLARVDTARQLFSNLAGEAGQLPADVVFWAPAGNQGLGLIKVFCSANGLAQDARFVQGAKGTTYEQSVPASDRRRVIDLSQIDNTGMRAAVGTLGVYGKGFKRAFDAGVDMTSSRSFHDVRDRIKSDLDRRLSRDFTARDRDNTIVTFNRLIKNAEIGPTKKVQVDLVSGLVPAHMVPNDNSNFINDLHSDYLGLRPRANSSERVKLQSFRPRGDLASPIKAEADAVLTTLRTVAPSDPFLTEQRRFDFQFNAERQSETSLSDRNMPATVRKRAQLLTLFAREQLPESDTVRDRIIVVPDPSLDRSDCQSALMIRRSTTNANQFTTRVRTADGFEVYHSGKKSESKAYGDVTVELHVSLKALNDLGDLGKRPEALAELQSSIWHQLHTLDQMRARHTQAQELATGELTKREFKKDPNGHLTALEVADQATADLSASDMQQRLRQSYSSFGPPVPVKADAVAGLKGALEATLSGMRTFFDARINPVDALKTPTSDGPGRSHLDLDKPVTIKISDEIPPIKITGLVGEGNNIFFVTPEGRLSLQSTRLIEEAARTILIDDLQTAGSHNEAAQSILRLMNHTDTRMVILGEVLATYEHHRATQPAVIGGGIVDSLLTSSLRNQHKGLIE